MFPTLNIICDDGLVFAGQSYNLTCTVTLENAARPPTIEWFDPNNNPLSSGNNITVGDTVAVNCFTYTTTVHFTTLRTSHGGQYSCQVTLGTLNNSKAINITVLSKSILLYYVVMVLVSLCLYVIVLCSSITECDYCS